MSSPARSPVLGNPSVVARFSGPPLSRAGESGDKFDYYLELMPWFDTGPGYKRIGSGAASALDTARGYADIWRSHTGEVVARMTSQGHRIAFKVLTESGAPVLDEEIDIVNDDLMNLLDLWILYENQPVA
jgi:hypothetical protein